MCARQIKGVPLGRATGILFGVWTLCITLPAPPALAQISVGTDITFSSRYVSRGLTGRNASLIRPDLFLAYSRDETILTAGWWMTFEPTKPDSLGLGTGKTFFGETGLWMEASRDLGTIDAAVGLTAHYFDRGPSARLLHDVRETYEVYARARIGDWIIVPLVTARYDLDAVKGLFLETGATFRIPVWRHVLIPVGSLFLTANAGFSFGQEMNLNAPRERSYFDEDGLVFIDVSLGTTIGYLPLGGINNAFHAAVHSQINRDERTKFVGADHRKDVKWWVTLTLTSVGPRCRPTRNLCNP